MALRAELDSKGYEVLNLRPRWRAHRGQRALRQAQARNRALERAEAATEGARAAGEEARRGRGREAAERSATGRSGTESRVSGNISLVGEREAGVRPRGGRGRIKAGGAGRDDQDNQMVDRRIVYKLLTRTWSGAGGG